MNWKLKHRVLDGEYERRGKELKIEKRKKESVEESYIKCMKIIDEFIEKFGKNV